MTDRNWKKLKKSNDAQAEGVYGDEIAGGVGWDGGLAMEFMYRRMKEGDKE